MRFAVLDLGFLAFLGAVALLGLKRPFLWVLAFIYVDIVSPQDISWGFLKSIPVSLLFFLAAFGGAGILATLNGTGLAISILAALAGGVVMSLLFWLVVGKWLFSLQGTSQARDIDMIGMEAEVITPLAHDKTGEIAYNLRGTRFTSPARLSTEGEVGRNEKVRIRLKKDNTVYVDRQRKLLE